MDGFKISTEQDRGWAWVILAGTTINTFVSLGVALACGVYVTEIIHNWNITKANGALVGSLLFGIFCCIAPLSTILASRTSHRTAIILGGVLSSIGFVASANASDIISFYFTFSILGGIGCGMVFIQSVVLVNLYFNRYRGIASGITMTGGGIGVLGIPLLERFLIDHFSWQPSLYIIAGLCLNTCAVGALMRPILLKSAERVQEISSLHRPEIKRNAEHMNENTRSSDELQLYAEEDLSLFKNKTYICYAINQAIWGLSCTVPIILGPDLYSEMGFVGIQIDILISCFGFGNIIGRIVGGVLCNIRKLNRLTLYVVLTIFLGGLIALYTASDTFILYAIASTGYGLVYGAHLVTSVVVPMDIVGRLKMEQALSFVFFTASLGVIAGPPLSGLLFDMTKSYKWPYLIAAMALICSSSLLVPSVIAGSRWCASKNRPVSNKTTNKMIISNPVKISDSMDNI